MRKQLTHIVIILSFFALAGVSCKGKKAAGNKEGVSEKAQAESVNQTLFGMAFIDGCSARLKGNIEEAKKKFLECNRLDPSNNAVKYELAIIYKLLGVNDQALYYAKACAQAEPTNEWYQLTLIECYNVLKQYNQSVKLRENLVKNFPDNVEFKEDLAIEYTILRQYDKAYKIYDDLEKIYGINEQISLKKSSLLKSQGKYKEAENELLRLLQNNPNEVRFYSYLADFYIEQNKLPAAKAMYDKIIEIEPNNPIVNLALHDYYSVQGKTAEALECLKKAFLNPDLEPVPTKRDIMQSFYARRDDSPYYRESGEELAKIFVQVHPQIPEANAIYADYLMEDKKVKEAAEYYSKALFKEKNNLGSYDTWEKLLKADSRLGRYDSLERHSAIAMESFPSIATFYYYNGFANIQLRNFKKAAQSLKDGLEFVVDNRIQMTDFYTNLGEAYYYSKEYDKAYKAFEDALKIDADNKTVLNQYAYYLLMQNADLEKAEKLARKVNELEHDNPSYMDTYGWILYHQKKYSEAEKWLQDAIKAGTKKPVILEHYGDALYKNGKTSEALKYWEAAKMAGGSSEGLLKKIKEKKLDD